MKTAKNQAQQAAEVVWRFCGTDDRPLLARPYHDKKAGVVVATDSRRIIITRHGFNPFAKDPDGVFPKYSQLLPKNVDEEYPHAVWVNVPRLAKVCKAAVALARAIRGEKKHTRTPEAICFFEVAGHVCGLDAELLIDTLEAMQCNNARFLQFSTKSPDGDPVLMQTKETTVLQMPVRGGGRAAAVTINGETCELEPIPEPKPLALVVRREWHLWKAACKTPAA